MDRWDVDVVECHMEHLLLHLLIVAIGGLVSEMEGQQHIRLPASFLRCLDDLCVTRLRGRLPSELKGRVVTTVLGIPHAQWIGWQSKGIKQIGRFLEKVLVARDRKSVV